jgi:transcriptional regulator with XRE-family HTH domain
MKKRAKRFNDKLTQFTPDARQRIELGAQDIRDELRLLREIREIMGISQEELAEKLEVGQSYISRLERRQNITLATLTNIVRVLGGTIDITVKLPKRKPVVFPQIESLLAATADE